MEKMLGLTKVQAAALFRPLMGSEVMCGYSDITPADAAGTLRWLADTGRVEWLADPKVWKHHTKRAPDH